MTPSVDPFKPVYDQPVRLVDDARGRFYLAGTGIEEVALQSVSALIAENRIGADYSAVPIWQLARKARIGTAVHKAVEIILGGEEVDGLHRDVEPYVKGFRKFIAEYKLEPRLLETPLRSELYACTLDVAGLLDGEPVVIDVKTTVRLHKLPVGVQVTAQKRCLAGPLLGYALQLKKDGTYTLADLNDPWYEEVLEAALTLSRARGRVSV